MVKLETSQKFHLLKYPCINWQLNLDFETTGCPIYRLKENHNYMKLFSIAFWRVFPLQRDQDVFRHPSQNINGSAIGTRLITDLPVFNTSQTNGDPGFKQLSMKIVCIWISMHHIQRCWHSYVLISLIIASDRHNYDLIFVISPLNGDYTFTYAS